MITLLTKTVALRCRVGTAQRTFDVCMPLPGDLFYKPLPGVNIDLLMNISAAANLTVTFDVFKLPDSVQNATDKTLSLLYLFYNLGYDCVVTATQLNAYRTGYMNFLNAYQPYGVIHPARAGIAVISDRKSQRHDVRYHLLCSTPPSQLFPSLPRHHFLKSCGHVRQSRGQTLSRLVWPPFLRRPRECCCS